MGKEKKRLHMSLYINSSWETIYNIIPMWNYIKRMRIQFMSFYLLGLLVIPVIVDCDTVEYLPEPIVVAEYPFIYIKTGEETWKKKTSRYIETIGLAKPISQQTSSVISAKHNTTHKSLNSRSRKRGSVAVVSKMR